MKRNYAKRIVTFLLAVFMVFTSIPCENLKVFAAQTEKKLVQSAENWQIFQYLDAKGKPAFDVKYKDKASKELEKDNLTLRYRFYYLETDGSAYFITKWYTEEEHVSKSLREDFKEYKDNYYIQFQVVDSSDKNISTSYTILLWPQEQTFPYVLQSNIDYCMDYDLTKGSKNSFKVKLLYSENLTETDVAELTTNHWVITEEISTPVVAKNLTFTNSTKNVEIDNSVYSVNTCSVSFDLELPKTCYGYNVDVGDTYVTYAVGVKGVKGGTSDREPIPFSLTVCTPIVPSDNKFVKVKKVSINSSTDILEVGDTLQLKASFTPKNATNKKVMMWHSSNMECATISDNGLVTAKAPGTTTITVISESNTSKRGVFDITIVDSLVSVENISIQSPAKTVALGKKLKLTTNIRPVNATSKTLLWSISNKNWATVDKNGVVTAKKAGIGKTVTITAKTYDGSNKKAKIKLKITNNIAVKKIRISGKKNATVGKKLTLVATITPSNASNKALKWTSSNKNWATVNQKGVVTPKKSGRGKTVTITATAKDDSKKKATFKIKLK
ncbi:MAG: Ig-like domain-containing protein [Lachnospiraceae bacterium]|nr:Ig-like domain-containing protein [Lachnospiraceae bacterium]